MKKKGLIISTVVMAVVLIASLTTATYAWFSSTAQAKVENLSISTKAAEGLMIGVKNGDDTVYSGALTYTSSKWGGTDNYGPGVDFSSLTQGETASLGTWNSAVSLIGSNSKLPDGTQLTTANVYELVTMGTTYVDSNKITAAAVTAGIVKDTQVESSSALVAVKAGDDYDSTKKYYKAVSSAPTTGYALPIGYYTVSGKKVPYGYTVAVPNVNYLSLPISLQANSEMTDIYCTLTINPARGTMAENTWANKAPGMAAASRIEISGNDNSIVFEPYTKYTYNNMTQSGAAATKSGTFELNFVVATGSITQGTVIDLNFIIWIEGTDDFCVDATNGSQFGIDISFGYSKTSLTYTDAAASATVTANGTNGTATDQTMTAIAYSKSTKVGGTSGVTYYYTDIVTEVEEAE